MIATLLSAAVTCFAVLFLGQAALRCAGATEWSWLAAPIGMSIAMLCAAPANHVPGRCATVAALLGVLAIAAAVWCLRTPAHRPPVAGLLTAAPVFLLVLVPFLAAGRSGILGTSMNNDMAAHISYANGYLSQAAAAVTPLPLDYPLGPHALVALIAKGLGVRVDQAFAGWALALPILNAWTVLALVRRSSWLGQALTATVVGMPFLVAAYYGQGAFKEVLLAGLVLALALLLSGCGPTLGRGRWAPFALLVGGIVSVYSVTGLPWPLAFAGLWLAGAAVHYVARGGGVGGLARSAREELPAIGIGAAVLAISLLPQLPRLERYVSLRSGVNGTGIRKEDLGNLLGGLPGWEAFGVWNNADFRLPASPAFTGGMWTAFVLALVLLGAVWAIRRGRWMLPFAAAGSMAIWALSAHSQSPYVAAKALVVASPLLLALAALPLVERGAKRPPWWTIAPLLALVLFVRVGVSDVQALRISPVGPTDHMSELHSLRPVLAGRPTLFLGNDDYVVGELAAVPLGTPVLNAVAQLPIRPQKAWSYGQALDFDSVDAATLNAYDWVITTRDAAGSAPPPQMRLVRTTDSYALWRRTGTVAERSVLAEGQMAGAVLDCEAPAGAAVVRAGGVAALRAEPVEAPAPPVAPGGTESVRLALGPGKWELQTPYTSPLPVAVTGPGLRATLPPNLDRPGPRWRIGRIAVAGRRPTVITLHTEKTALMPAVAGTAVIGAVIATPVAPQRIVPVRRACGRYVDWYRSEGSGG